MNKIINFLFIAFLLALPIFAQSGNSDRCEVIMTDIQSKKTTKLGIFTTVIAEEELTTRAFKLPQTNLFIVASVFYTDESLASKKGNSSVSLQLALSETEQRDVLNSLNWAEAELPLHDFDVGRITMLVKIKSRVQFVMMECKENVRL